MELCAPGRLRVPAASEDRRLDDGGGPEWCPCSPTKTSESEHCGALRLDFPSLSSSSGPSLPLAASSFMHVLPETGTGTCGVITGTARCIGPLRKQAAASCMEQAKVVPQLSRPAASWVSCSCVSLHRAAGVQSIQGRSVALLSYIIVSICLAECPWSNLPLQAQPAAAAGTAHRFQT